MITKYLNNSPRADLSSPFGEGLSSLSEGFNFYIMHEIWKDLTGSNGAYQISNTGRIRNKIGNILSTQKTNAGYLLVHLHVNGKRTAKTMHRLVALHFCNPPDDFNKLQVNHIDCNKLNNNSENLEWVTNKENNKHAWDNGRHEVTREKARHRMRQIGIKNAKTNELRLRKYYDENKEFYINNCKKLAISQRKPVEGINNIGHVVRFDSIRNAYLAGFRNVSSSIKKSEYCKGYKFKYI